MAEQEKINTHFLSLIYSLSAAAMHQLGKAAGAPDTKAEKNLDQAKISIDIIDMLNEKTRGNLTPEEEKLLTSILAKLQLDYVWELENGDDKKDKIN